ncbi:MAG: hypothetical protein KAS32_06980 [Candidatus Peribacteraceae bacterium]|nr:hypothetical protein [Candidatus Peribacteraceae bacterium]
MSDKFKGFWNIEFQLDNDPGLKIQSIKFACSEEEEKVLPFGYSILADYQDKVEVYVKAKNTGDAISKAIDIILTQQKGHDCRMVRFLEEDKGWGR